MLLLGGRLVHRVLQVSQWGGQEGRESAQRVHTGHVMHQCCVSRAHCSNKQPADNTPTPEE